ncbi:hypothetical protein [Paeniglutamicibacter psychrophenolicus]|uniref:hypothetical protein n=1 Tax=Paeniglutamicibacter psychrophenolicus TaxID=257454 RepID=UPI00278A4DAE|nr:hypothetical protein [Paeniglutamicibacter psychrophenolicus]MDQ0094648.1 hypothetical protein [Paeniglutamicibacter psychrophenolicus]
MAEQLESTPVSSDWVRVLDELEEHLARLRDCGNDDERLLEMRSALWRPPANIGQLPAALAPRATALNAAMEALVPEIRQRRDETARQLRAVESVPREDRLTSVYLDSVG